MPVPSSLAQGLKLLETAVERERSGRAGHTASRLADATGIERSRVSRLSRELSALGYLGMVHGVRELACDALEGRIDRRPSELLPDMLEWILPTLEQA